MNTLLTPQLLVPFLITNAVFVLILWYSFTKQNRAEGLLAILFLGSGIFNIYTAFTDAAAYHTFANSALLPFYRDFILGFFSDNTVIVVSTIAVGQLFIAFSLLMDDLRYRIGCLGGMIFGIAIAPLGLGSAFPSTLVMSLAFLVLLLRSEHAHSTSRS